MFFKKVSRILRGAGIESYIRRARQKSMPVCIRFSVLKWYLANWPWSFPQKEDSMV